MTIARRRASRILKTDIARDDWLYLAGLFDGEGCIFGYVSRNRYHRLRTTVCNTNAKVIEWILSVFGGRITHANGRNKPQHIWYMDSLNDVKGFLHKILPYLKVKRLQAETGIRYLDCIENNGDWNSAYLLYLELRRLKEL